MKTGIILLLCFSAITIHVAAQNKTKTYRFHSVNSLAFVNGNNASTGALQSVNGFQKKNWFAGVGVGLDYYLYRTIPLFADLRYEIGKKKNKFFAYGDAGINTCWVEDNNSGNVFIWDGGMNDSEFFNGVYTDVGFGYKIGMKNENALVLALGHSHKSLKEETSYLDWRTQQMTKDTREYKLNRILIKVGWQF